MKKIFIFEKRGKGKKNNNRGHIFAPIEHLFREKNRYCQKEGKRQKKKVLSGAYLRSDRAFFS